MGKDLRKRVAGIALGDQRVDLARHGETFRSRSFRYKPESSPKLIGTSDTGYRRYDAGGIDNATAIAAFAGMMEAEAGGLALGELEALARLGSTVLLALD